ncbi:hypothetical protein KDA06_00760 [Candidatus Saccharibacteria bacterium]|jgi:hypothetical protein|nr:hypothetical protein [Candidatus Saccharibacteria bacterium]HPR09417.1 hypothetical protein [Candidatus Saccharibacteria bacterium]
MSLVEKFRHQRKSESKARSQHHKHDGHKMAAVVNEQHHQRLQTLIQMRKDVGQA